MPFIYDVPRTGKALTTGSQEWPSLGRKARNLVIFSLQFPRKGILEPYACEEADFRVQSPGCCVWDSQGFSSPAHEESLYWKPKALGTLANSGNWLHRASLLRLLFQRLQKSLSEVFHLENNKRCGALISLSCYFLGLNLLKPTINSAEPRFLGHCPQGQSSTQSPTLSYYALLNAWSSILIFSINVPFTICSAETCCRPALSISLL